MPSTNKVIENLNKKLEDFLLNNPYSNISKYEKVYVVEKPWNDESLVIFFPQKRKNLIDTLILLPIKTG